MTRPLRPEVTPQMVEMFAFYYATHPGWGSLHVVLEDLNVRDGHVRGCQVAALVEGDQEGWLLAQVLLGLSPGQRHKVARLVELWMETPRH